ncbi:MAG: amidohydrolase family protein [Longimicrobiales bacterium]
MKTLKFSRFSACLLLLLPAAIIAQDAPAGRAGGSRSTEPANPLQEGLPLKPERTIRFTTEVGSWLSLDVSPDGQTIVFDHLGDLYTMPITGGKATPLTRGMAVDAQPRFSPDGKRITFVSDRKGASNLWIMSLDKRDTVQLTKGRTDSYDSPEFTPDGKYVIGSRGNNLFMFHVDGGSGVQIGAPAAAATPAPGGATNAVRYIGAAFGKDPRYLWIARRAGAGQWVYNDPIAGAYDIAVFDRETGVFSTRADRWGSAFRPTLSPDGKWLVYGTRYDQQTGLRIRDLETNAERWLAYPVQRDDQESRASRDVYPGMSFTPDSKQLIATWGGKVWRVPVDGGTPSQIPFSVDVEQHLGPEVKFEYPVSDDPTFNVRQIRNAVPSPDGKRLAFTALDRMYVVDVPAGGNAMKPVKLVDAAGYQFQPAWSPDGKSIVYVTWVETQGGHIWKVPSTGGRSVRLSTEPAYFQQPVFTSDGQKIVVVRGSAPAYQEETTQGGNDFVWISANGGSATLIMPTSGLGNAHFVKNSDRIYASGGRGLVSFRWDGTDIREHLRVSAPAAGAGGGAGASAGTIFMAPDGDQALALVGSDAWVVTVPFVGGTTPSVTVGDNPNFPARRLSEIGAQFPHWDWSGEKVHFSIGNAHVIYDLAKAKIFDDSVRAANRARAPADSAARDSTQQRDTTLAGGPPAGTGRAPRAAATPPTFKPYEFRILVTAQRDIPQGNTVLRGGRVVTMKGDEVIENADIVIRNNRIIGVGARGSVQIPDGAHVVDITGKTVTPGFVDTHSHLRVPQTIHRGEVWSYAANLAYGVTAARDPQTGSTDVLTYEDELEAGDILGPRGWSTGPGVFSGENFRSLEHARTVLKRYSEYYNTNTIKQYVAGNREQRQWIIQAAREQKLMPTTEGSLDMEMNLTEAIDGYSGHEHTWPTFPMQEDVIKFLAQSGIAYTPTIIVAYGGPWAENYWYENTDVHNDPKVRRFLPHAEVDAKTLRRATGGQAGGWFAPSEHIMSYVSDQVADLVHAGGRAGIGSHGQFQGLGYHWEMWNVGFGKKLTPHEVLRIATIGGADDIGRAQNVGSVEAGKLADLVIFDLNPLENLRNTTAIRYVMKNGRLYDANTLDEVWPRQTKAKFYWQTGEPTVNTTIGR